MSLDRCIPDLLARGAIDREQADEMLAGFEELRRLRRGQMEGSAADQAASEQVLRQTLYAASLKRRQGLLAAQKQGEIAARIEATMAAGGNPLAAATDVMATRVGGMGVSLESRHLSLRREAHGYLAGLIDRYGAALFKGRITRGDAPPDLVRAIFGEAVADPAITAMGRAASEVFEWLRLRRNAAGGATAKLEGWGLPQAHDARKVRDAGFAAWRDFMQPLLNVGRMIDYSTGEAFSPEALELALREAWETIRTEGWNKRAPGTRGRGALHRQRMDHRFLHFKDADSWLAYNARFGDGNAFDAIVGHIEGMTRDIAAMETLGPDPAATVAWLGDLVEQKVYQADTNGAVFAKALESAGQPASHIIRQLWDTYTGAANVVVNQKFADLMSGTRAWLTAAHLGSAILSAVVDPVVQSYNHLWNGLPATGFLGDMLKSLNPLDAADREFAAQAGAGLDDALGHITALLRYTGEATVHGKVQWLAAATLRLSGLNAWTEAGKRAHAKHWAGHLASIKRAPWDQLDEATQAVFRRYDIHETQWEQIRAAPAVERGGAMTLVPADVRNSPLVNAVQADELVTRLMALVTSEERSSVVQTGLTARTVAASGGGRGTLSGEIVRSLLLFKQYPLEFLWNIVLRPVRDTSRSVPLRVAYATLFPAVTLAGAFVIQLRQVAQGKDPRPMDDPRFWTTAALQGGGLGLFGDFLFAEEGRFGRSPLVDAMGPVAGAANDLLAAQRGAMASVRSGEFTNPGREATRLLRAYTPGHSLWYARLVFDRYLFDNLQAAIDPEYEQAFARQQQRLQTEYGQGYWWAPGMAAPDRAPDFGNLEGAEQ